MRRITALYFSPTRTTRTVVSTIARHLTDSLQCDYSEIDITTPVQRSQTLQFSKEDLVVFGAPVYIGRMPNLIAPYFKTIQGGGAIGIPVVVYGNRAYDDGLIELRDILEADGFRLIAAAAFIGEHSFSRILGGGRPDALDLQQAEQFAKNIADLLNQLGKEGFLFQHNKISNPETLKVPGTPYPYSGFYKATDTTKKSVDIRKVVPKTDRSRCTNCGLCAQICAMGAIDPTDCFQITGKCIKCGACIKRCPQGAKYFDDPQYLSHLQALEDQFSGHRCEPECFYFCLAPSASREER